MSTRTGPIRAVRPERCRHSEPAGELRVYLHGAVLFELIRKPGLDVGLVDDLLEHRLGGTEHVPEIPRQLFVFEQLLRIVVILAEPLVLDAVH